MQFAWMDALIAQMPADWQPELESKTEDERLLEVPAELQTAYRAAMWATGEERRILDEHEAEHEAEDEPLETYEASDFEAMAAKCAKARAKANDMKHRGAALGASVLLAIRDTAKLAPDDKIRLRSEGVVVVPEVKIESLFGGLLGGVTVIRI